MPFDVLSFDWSVHVVEQTDPLALLGIEPIPQDAVKAYKTAYRKVWIKNWRLANFTSLDPPVRWATCRQGKRTLEVFLRDPLAGSTFGADWSPMPEPLREIARFIAREVPDTEFKVDHFWDDPVLWVVYPFGGKKIKACLGIWENGEIKMIAKTE